MNSTTKKVSFAGLKEFRQSVTKYAKQAQSEQVVVMNRNKPLFTLLPFRDDEYLDEVIESIAVAKADVAAGRVFSEAEVLRALSE